MEQSALGNAGLPRSISHSAEERISSSPIPSDPPPPPTPRRPPPSLFLSHPFPSALCLEDLEWDDYRRENLEGELRYRSPHRQILSKLSPSSFSSPSSFLFVRTTNQPSFLPPSPNLIPLLSSSSCSSTPIRLTVSSCGAILRENRWNLLKGSLSAPRQRLKVREE